jgi:hypothetical protein
MPLPALSDRLLQAVRSLWSGGRSPLRETLWVERQGVARSSRHDTVASWPPQAARVLTDAEAEALDLARRAAPRALVLAQVPLWRFVRVSARQSYTRWLQRVGYINADLLICDPQGTVLAVVDVHREPMSERSQRRHDRLRRVLRATGTPVLVWQQGRLPSLVKVRAQFGSHGIDCRELDEGIAPRKAVVGAHAAAAGTAPAAAPPARARATVPEAVPSDFHGLHTVPSTIL